VTAWLLEKVMINLGAVLGILPIAGVPLPFVSYGGSSLLPSMAAIGMLVSFARTGDGRTGDGGAQRADKLSRRPQAQRNEGRTS